MTAQFTVKINSLTSSGEGVGSMEGMKVFVDGALPEETVTIRLREQKKSYAIGELLQVKTASPHRTAPPCPLSGVCGGCQIMHLNYASQLEVKRQRVVDALMRIGGFHNFEVLPCLPSPQSLGYRNKIQLPLIWENGQKQIGLYRKQSHEIIPLEKCLIQCPEGEAIFTLIQERVVVPSIRFILIRNAVFNQEALVVFVTTGHFFKELQECAEALMANHPSIKGVVENINTRTDNVILSESFRLLAGRPYIEEKILGKRFKISPSAFFQVNPAQTEKLYAKAIEFASIQPQDVVLDAYCGVGALAILAAEKCKFVYGTECIQKAIEDAIHNSQLNGIKNCSFFCGRAENLIDQFDQVNVVFLNPPRKGCESHMLKSLIRKKPDRIVYISCDPATLARDLKFLNPSYEIQILQPVDMFPQTMHVETISLLRHKVF